MNIKQKLCYIEKHIKGLKYLNSILLDAISFYEETGDLDCQFYI